MEKEEGTDIHLVVTALLFNLKKDFPLSLGLRELALFIASGPLSQVDYLSLNTLLA